MHVQVQASLRWNREWLIKSHLIYWIAFRQEHWYYAIDHGWFEHGPCARMTGKIVKRSTFFAPHCPSLCSQILTNNHFNSFWPRKSNRISWRWRRDCQQYRGRCWWGSKGRGHHFETFPLVLRHLLWKGPLDGQRAHIGRGCSCC